MDAREVAFNFCEWLIDMGYSSKEDCEEDIDEVIEELARVYDKYDNA